MKKIVNLLSCLALIPGLLFAAEGPLFGRLDGQVLATGSKLLLIDHAGKTLWEYKAGNCGDVWMLDNGHVLFANGSVVEVDPKTDEVVFKYTPEMTKQGGTYSCQRLANGNTVVGESSAGRFTEVDPSGKIIFKLDLPMTTPGHHQNLRMVRKLDNGNYLVCHHRKALVREYTPAGEVKLDIKVPGKGVFSAIRLPNGNTMTGHINGITEYSPDGNVVWSFEKSDLPDLALGSICGIHVQPNGNVAMGIYRIAKEGKSAEFLEITREKKLVWRYKAENSPRARMGVHVLTRDGKPGENKPLR
jgi:hypothetical protein